MIFASGSWGDCHSLFDVFLPFRDRSKRANSARVGVSIPEASARRCTNASYDAPVSRRSMLRIAALISDHVTSRHADYVIDRYKAIPPGANWEAIANKLTNYTAIERTHSNIYRRLTWDDLPSVNHHRALSKKHARSSGSASRAVPPRSLAIAVLPRLVQICRIHRRERSRIGSQAAATGKCGVPASSQGHS